MEVKVKYFSDEVKRIEHIGGKGRSNWIDLRSAENVCMKAGESRYIKLGVGMKLPDGYEAHIVPRSSTFNNYGIIQTNHIGVIDSSYCGDNDQWMMPVYATRDCEINVNDRICQFRIVKMQPDFDVTEVDKLEDTSRGGFGSTGTN